MALFLAVYGGYGQFGDKKCGQQICHEPYSIYAVELKTGPIFAFSSVKNWSIFCFFVCENLILPAERRGFFKKKKNKQEKQHF